MGWFTRTIKIVDEYYTNCLIEKLETLGKKLNDNREQIDFGELIKIDRKIKKLSNEINDSINDNPNANVEEASEAEQSQLQQELEKNKID